MAEVNNPLLTLYTFRRCRRETLTRLWERGQRFRVRSKASPVQHAGEADAILLQLSGKSFLYSVTRLGHRRVFALVLPGMLVNPGRVSGSPVAVHCEMLESGEVLAVPREDFTACMRRDWGLVELVLEQQRCRIQEMEHHLRNSVSSLQGEFRMASLLLELARRCGVNRPAGVEIDLELNVSLLGDLLGIPRESASRLRKALAQQGLIRMEGRRITVVSLQRLDGYLHSGSESAH